jgi:hypothetical protein
MAVLAIIKCVGITKQMYEMVRREVQWETKIEPGGLLHVCAFDGSGEIHVADVWESDVALSNFMNRRLIPCMKKLGFPEPSVAVYPIHNFNCTAGIQQYLVD